MNEIWIVLGYMLVLGAVSIAGAALPQVRKLTDSQTHYLIALSAGIFLGLLFVLLVPEAYEISVEHEGHGFETVSYMLMIGFLAIAFVDILIKHFHLGQCPCGDHHCVHDDDRQHEVSSLSAFIGLSVHACCDGLALAAAFLGGEEIGFVALIGMCVHKFVVLFSLSSSLLLTDRTTKSRWIYLGAFTAITPISAVISYLSFNVLSLGSMTGLPMAFAAGTFMFVTFCNMLPEAFHRKDQELKSLFIVLLGVALAVVTLVLVNMMGGHHHH